MSLFPPAQDIDADMLYLLLAAEDLITIESPEGSRLSLTKLLGELARLKLIQLREDMVPTRSISSCAYESCRLHHQVREFCKFKGVDEEFLEIVDFENSKQVVGHNTRRLAIYMRNYRGGSCNIWWRTKRKILSLLVFDAFESAAEGNSGWPLEIGFLISFAHLRVLNYDQVDFRLRKLPEGLDSLRLLRYLSFRGCFLEELPSYLSCLKQLETLDLLVRDECNMIIPGNIFTTMKRMVHLYLPRLYQGKGKRKLTLQGLETLETLINFDTEVFDVADLSQLKKLKILSTITKGQYPKDMDAVIVLLNERGEQLQHSSLEIRRFDGYNGDCVLALKKLLQCRFVHSLQIEGQIGKLPEEEDGGGGERVAEMVLHGSELKDDYLGKFQNLRSLVLADDAFMGARILVSSSPLFPKLRSLKLRNLQYLEELAIEDGAVRELSSPHIESCGGALQLTIPEQLYRRLKKEIGGHAYSVVPTPSILNITPTP